MLRYFNNLWSSVPTAFCDTETTGTRVGTDKAVEVAIVRFENMLPVARVSSRINPGIPIPAESTAIHGVTDDMVKDSPSITDFFNRGEVIEVLKDAQPGAYNGQFDKWFVPPFFDPWDWPWLDALSFVRKFDRYERGEGRHKLGPTCTRHGVVLENAHTAEADAEATGLLFYKFGHRLPKNYTLGQLLAWQRRIEAAEWERFYQWLANQPPK